MRGGARVSASRAPLVLRDAGEGDLPMLLALNDAAVPAVNRLGMREFEGIVGLGCWVRVAEGDAGVVGFLLCIPSGAGYGSENYRWFRERYDDFLYLDRVVVGAGMRGRGVGGRLYAEMHAFAATRWPRVVLEVNRLPPNPGSDRFHRRLGYEAVGERVYDDGASAVTMYERRLSRT